MPGTTTSRLPIYALAFLAGVYTLLSLPSLDVAWSSSAVLPVILFLLLILKSWRFAILFFLAGFAWTAFFTAQQLLHSLPHSLAGKNIVVEGHVEGLPEKDGRVVRFNLNVFNSEVVNGNQIQGKIRVSDYRRQSIDPQPGEAWRLLLRVKPAHGFANPAGFDYEQWLFNQRIIATAYIRKDKTHSLGNDQVNHRLPEFDQPSVIDNFRLRIAQQIKIRLPDSPHRGIIIALATGDRREISSQQWSVLQKTGTSHLMAISGLHVGLVAGVVFFLFRYFWAMIPGLALRFPAHKAAALTALLFAGFYCLLAGFSLPTQRALLMLTLLCITVISERHVRALDILSLTVLVVLIFDPLSILSAGFWLSFGAVVMILYTLLYHQNKDRWSDNCAAKAMRLQWKLSLMMAPVTLLFFQQIPVAGPVANLVAIPVIAFLIVPQVLLASLSFLISGSGFVDQYIFIMADFALQLIWSLLEIMADASILPFSPELSIAAITGLLFSVLIVMLPAGLKMRKLAIVGLLVFFFPHHAEFKEGEFRLILLDVGQGLSAIIRTGQHALLFDTGAKFSQRFNAADAVVLPVLKSLSVEKLDTMIISHGDNDHSGGVAAILAGIKVRQVLSNENIQIDNLTSCLAGMQWQWEGVIFRVLHPEENNNFSGNNASCVLHVQSPYGSVLLPADIEKDAEYEIISRYPGSLHSNILVAPHHGSKTSSSDDFLDAIAPDLVLFPAGWMNRYQHPATVVINRLAEKKIASRFTGECGSVSVRAEQGGITVESWRQSNRKVWDRTETDKRCMNIAIRLPEIPAF